MVLEILVIGALMGILGQGARAIIGLKGMSDTAKAQGLGPNDLFEAGRLIVSFLIGIVVGLASVLVYLKNGGATGPNDPTWQTMLAWAVSAYAGTDFLEGFISQYLSKGAGIAGTTTGAPPPPPRGNEIMAVRPSPPPPPPAKPPRYTPDQATGWVTAAFEALGIPGVTPDNQLGKDPIDYSTNDFDYPTIYMAINDQIKNDNPKNVLLFDSVMRLWSGSTKVSDLINQVQHAPTGLAT